ncbi:Tryptophan--tRNA ligase, mitochondrial [Ascosphaera aggregata]|nr:Tryptophan--tRNA ligase, mitochondrial [Ascosphaera aggregata]
MTWPSKVTVGILSSLKQQALPHAFCREVLRRLSTEGAGASAVRDGDHHLARQPPKERIVFSGIQPTGIPHLGNYLGALKEWVRLQDTRESSSTKLIFSIVDLHALTVPKDSKLLRQWRKEALAILLAIGLDPKKSTIFLQSASKISVSEGASLDNEAVRAKLRLGLFSYPVLQAADILVHRATDVPVGEDQKQHIEFTRDTANSFNYLYGDVFTVPTALISPSKRVMSLREPRSKMSKSHNDPRSRILLSDSSEDIHKKIKKAITDSEPNITYDRINRPGVSNLIEILSHIEGDQSSPDEIAARFHHHDIRVFKEHVAQKLSNHLRGIREKYAALIGENSSLKYLDEVAEEGARAAQANADITMRTVKEAMGL